MKDLYFGKLICDCYYQLVKCELWTQSLAFGLLGGQITTLEVVILERVGYFFAICWHFKDLNWEINREKGEKKRGGWLSPVLVRKKTLWLNEGNRQSHKIACWTRHFFPWGLNTAGRWPFWKTRIMWSVWQRPQTLRGETLINLDPAVFSNRTCVCGKVLCHAASSLHVKVIWRSCSVAVILCGQFCSKSGALKISPEWLQHKIVETLHFAYDWIESLHQVELIF